MLGFFSLKLPNVEFNYTPRKGNSFRSYLLQGQELHNNACSKVRDQAEDVALLLRFLLPMELMSKLSSGFAI